MEAGDMKAMREVVLMLANVILPQQAEYPAEYGGGKVPDKDGWLAWVRAMQIKARAALAKPPRNCDVGTAEEQMKRQHDTMCNTTKACPDSDWSCRKCFAEWAQMPYKEGGAK